MDIPLEKVIEILDRHHVIDDMVTIEGVYGDFINPFAFQASKKGNNPDVLSRVQMMKAQDKEEFLKSEEPELRGLEDFDMFQYMEMSDIPETHKNKFLNTIWSYIRNEDLMGLF